MLRKTTTSVIRSLIPNPPRVKIKKILLLFLKEYVKEDKKSRKFTIARAIATMIENPNKEGKVFRMIRIRTAK